MESWLWKMNKLYRIKDGLDFFKKGLDLIIIWLRASCEVHKFTQPENIIWFYFQ